MNPKKKILILSGCLLTVAAVVGGTFFVQKSSNHVLNKTSIGKFHEAEEHTATGFVVCKTEALQEVFQQKKEEVLLAKQEVPDESEGKNEKTDKKGTQEVTPGKEPTEPASTAGGQALQLRKTQRHPGDRTCRWNSSSTIRYTIGDSGSTIRYTVGNSGSTIRYTVRNSGNDTDRTAGRGNKTSKSMPVSALDSDEF